MSTWSHGYVSDVSYTTGFYREITPSWLALATTLMGQRPPRTEGAFAWCELGCGQGFTAMAVAAAYPEAQVYGFDFNPAHIDNARTMARRAGIGNVRYDDLSFEELAEAPRGAYPQMDFIVMHGIWSWVSSTQRAHMLRFIRDRLAPGGVVYLSYNSLAGWAGMVPIQRLMRLWGEAHPSGSVDFATGVMGFLRELMATDALYFSANPAVTSRLESLGTSDPRYLAHEYLNATWEPMTSDAVARDLAEAKCGYIGSATLTDNIDAVAVPGKVAAMLPGISDPRLREAVRDIGAARPFRRDLFRRGVDSPAPGEQLATVDQIVMTGLGRESEANIQIATGIGSVSPRPEIYGPVLERLKSAPLPFVEMRQMPVLADKPLAEALQVLAFLAGGGLAHPSAPVRPSAAAMAPARALNREIGIANVRGLTLPYLVAPRLGTAVTVDPVDAMVLPEFAAGDVEDLNPVAARTIALLAQTGRMPVREGKPMTDPAEAHAAMLETLQRFARDRVPLLRRWGILDT